MLVFVAGQSPIRGRQILYFMDPTFSQRSKMAPPEKSDVVRATEKTRPGKVAAPQPMSAAEREDEQTERDEPHKGFLIP